MFEAERKLYEFEQFDFIEMLFKRLTGFFHVGRMFVLNNSNQGHESIKQTSLGEIKPIIMLVGIA